MEVFAVQTYFSTEFLAFFETLLQIRRPVLVGNELVENMSLADVDPPAPPLGVVATDAPPPGVVATDNAWSSGGAEDPAPRKDLGEEGRGKAAAAATALADASVAEGNTERGGGRGGGGGGVGSSSSTVPPIGQFDMLRVVSRIFLGKKYGMLTRELILKGAMPLGLYRPAGTKGSSLPYTQVNPSIAEPLVKGDVVFVLRSRSCSLVGSV